MNKTRDWGKYTILVAEDEDFNYMLIEEILLTTKAVIKRARNGQEVIHFFEDNTPPDLVLMDIKMPDISGIDATMAIRKNGYKGPVIAQTAYAMQNEKTSILEAGCNDIITKPYEPSTFLTKIEEWLDAKA